MIRRGGRRMEARRFWSSTDARTRTEEEGWGGWTTCGLLLPQSSWPPPTLTYLLAHRLQASRTYARAHCTPPLNALSHSLRPYVRSVPPSVRPEPESGRTQLHSLSLLPSLPLSLSVVERDRTLLGHRNRATAGGTGGGEGLRGRWREA